MKKLTEEDKKTLVELSEDPEMNYDHKGNPWANYHGVERTADRDKIDKVDNIMKKVFAGYMHFKNFQDGKNGKRIRFTSNYNHDKGLPFEGINYLSVSEICEW